jgi:hypothetical protein
MASCRSSRGRGFEDDRAEKRRNMPFRPIPATALRYAARRKSPSPLRSSTNRPMIPLLDRAEPDEFRRQASSTRMTCCRCATRWCGGIESSTCPCLGTSFFDFVRNLNLTFDSFGHFDPTNLSSVLRFSLVGTIALILCIVLQAGLVRLEVAGLKLEDFIQHRLANAMMLPCRRSRGRLLR